MSKAERYGPSYGTMADIEAAEALAAKGRRRRKIEAGVSLLAAALSLGVLYASRRVDGAGSAVILQHNPETGIAWQSSCTNGVCLYASNDYERALSRPIANGRFPDGVVLEMYRETRLEVDAEACELEISGSLDVRRTGGCLVEVRATALGEYWLTARVVEARSREARVVTYVLTAKYVRREIRDLTPDDRTRFLSAVGVTLRVSDEEGLRMYGYRYRSTDWYVRAHLYAASRSCSSFVATQSALAARFEMSLQSIDQRLALPYWDYLDGSLFADQHIADPEWFGPANPTNARRVVDSGRFAFAPVRTNAREYSTVTNPYGLLAAPWNTNPTPFVTRTVFRFGQYPRAAPTCALWLGMMRTARSLRAVDDALQEWSYTSGGAWNYLDHLRRRETDLPAENRGNYLALHRAWWRKGLLRCPDYCGHDAPPSSCACHLASNAANLTLATDQIANGGHAATLASDAAPNDPLFWLFLGTHERYLHQVRYLNHTGRYDFDLYSPAAPSPKYDAPDADCTGNHEHDLLAVDHDHLLLQPRQGGGPLTNGEYLALTAPFSPHLSYVYDQLLNWTHCGHALGFFNNNNNNNL